MQYRLKHDTIPIRFPRTIIALRKGITLKAYSPLSWNRIFVAIILSMIPCQSNGLETSSFNAVINLATSKNISWQFKPEGGNWKSIEVPGGGWRAQGYTCDAGVYRTTIRVPQYITGKTVRIAFDAVNFGADVYAGPNEAGLVKVTSHLNGWMPFTADVTSFVKPGADLLIQLDVKGRRKYMKNGKFTVAEGATWFSGLADGIIRGIALQILPQVRMEDVFVKTYQNPDSLQPKVTLANDTDKPVTVEIAFRVSSWNKSPFKYNAINPITAMLKPRSTETFKATLSPWKCGAASYWWPNVPYKSGYRSQLHVLNSNLKIRGSIVHQYAQRFGFRTFNTKGSKYLLNGIRCNLRGDNQQEADFNTDAYGIKAGFGTPTESNPGWSKAVDNLQRLNFNVMRIHQIPATPYMLDVCDEMGFMLVEESPLRGSEGGEDFEAGRDSMLNMDRELVQRDRNHPATIIWSAANEWTEPIRPAMSVMLALDNTRPIIADGVGDMGSDVINMQHYVNGLGGLPTIGGSPREDRPYGETEAVWHMDNTWQGFAWMATSIRLRRLKGNADLRNYVLNNAWPDYVPGEGPETEILEKKVKNMGGDMVIHGAINDPWSNPFIKLIQQCYHPLTACDVDFDRVNAKSDEKGAWPIIKPTLKTGKLVTRRIAVFNDEFNGEKVTLLWELHKVNVSGQKIAGEAVPLTIPCGEYRTQDISFTAPKEEGDYTLLLQVSKAGKVRFREEMLSFHILNHSIILIPDGKYRLISKFSNLPIEWVDNKLQQADAIGGEEQIWTLKNLGDDEIMLINKAKDKALTLVKDSTEDNVDATIASVNNKSLQVWTLEKADGGSYRIINLSTGKLLDVYGKSKLKGARVIQWDANGGLNQEWSFKESL